MHNYYIILGLDPNQQYEAKAIKKAWLLLTKEHHPDKGGDIEMFKKITHAYMMLTDPSYAAQEKQKEDINKKDLHVRFQVPITFQEGFFGTKFKINYGFNELDRAGNKVAIDPNAKIKTYRMNTHTVDIVIPEGTLLGGEMSFSNKGVKRIGEGDASEDSGDVHIMIQTLPHPRFRWDNEQGIMRSDIHVPLYMMLKGGELTIETMHGLKELRIRPATAPGNQIAIKGAGFKGGDHVVTVHPQYPTREELKSEEWKGLDIKWDANQETSRSEQDVQAMLNHFIKMRTNGGFGDRTF